MPKEQDVAEKRATQETSRAAARRKVGGALNAAGLLRRPGYYIEHTDAGLSEAELQAARELLDERLRVVAVGAGLEPHPVTWTHVLSATQLERVLEIMLKAGIRKIDLTDDDTRSNLFGTPMKERLDSEIAAEARAWELDSLKLEHKDLIAEAKARVIDAFLRNVDSAVSDLRAELSTGFSRDVGATIDELAALESVLTAAAGAWTPVREVLLEHVRRAPRLSLARSASIRKDFEASCNGQNIAEGTAVIANIRNSRDFADLLDGFMGDKILRAINEIRALISSLQRSTVRTPVPGFSFVMAIAGAWTAATGEMPTQIRSPLYEAKKRKAKTGKKPEIREYKTRFQDLMEVITPRLADGTMSVSDGLVRQVLESIVR